MPKSCKRVSELGASLVCNVESTKCPVSDACTAILAVSASRISPTIMISGSWRIKERIPSAKCKSTPGLTCIWLKAGSIISMGSSIVQTLTCSVASCLSVLYNVVVLPEPVGPVTKIMPFGCAVSSCQVSSCLPDKPS